MTQESFQGILISVFTVSLTSSSVKNDHHSMMASLKLDDWFRADFRYKIENSSQEHIDKKEEEQDNADSNADENQPISSSN